MLGSVGPDEVQAVVDALSSGRPQSVLMVSNALAEKSADFEATLAELIEALHRMAVDKSGVHPSPPAGTRRIAFIGDSVTLGREVQFEQIFSQVTEAILNGRTESVRYEALNFGIDGYNTPQIQRQLMTKVFRYSPDLVIYALCLNDFDFEEASGDKIRFFKKPESFLLGDLARGVR